MNSMMLIVRPILRPESESERDLAMAFDARASGGPDDRRMHGSGRQHHAIPSLQLEPAILTFEREGDRTVDAVEDLLVTVRVRGVAVAGPVGPRVAAARL